MGKSRATTEQKNKYNKANYKQFIIRVRTDDELLNNIEIFCARPGTSLNALVTKLLRQHFLAQDVE